MEFNGQEAKMNFFENLDIQNMPSSQPEPQLDYTRLLKEANVNGDIPARFADETFMKHSWKDEEKVMEFCLSNSDKCYILFGPSGVGKTSLMVAAMHERHFNGLSCGTYFSVSMLLPTLRASRSFSATENEEQFLRRLGNTPFLCLDEVGSCKNADEEREFLRTIISLRYDNKLPMMISTNLSGTNFKAFLTGVTATENLKEIISSLEVSDPVLNRLMSIKEFTVFNGTSLRGKND